MERVGTGVKGAGQALRGSTNVKAHAERHLSCGPPSDIIRHGGVVCRLLRLVWLGALCYVVGCSWMRAIVSQHALPRTCGPACVLTPSCTHVKVVRNYDRSRLAMCVCVCVALAGLSKQAATAAAAAAAAAAEPAHAHGHPCCRNLTAAEHPAAAAAAAAAAGSSASWVAAGVPGAARGCYGRGGSGSGSVAPGATLKRAARGHGQAAAGEQQPQAPGAFMRAG